MAFELDRVVIVGGAGFVGSHFVDHFLGREGTQRVTIYDNFSSGRPWHFAHHTEDARLVVTARDVNELDALTEAMVDTDLVIHLASNPDIARAVTEPTVDFDEGTALTNNVVEACRRAGVPRLMYASGSGVYGDLGDLEVTEDHGPLLPVSTYGASKLAGEALISSYCHLFGLSAAAFRFGNVVGRRQTHGVGLDFVVRLKRDPTLLTILGDGRQSKSYVHISDIVNAVVGVAEADVLQFEIFNVATGDYITVNEIAEIAMSVIGLDPRAVALKYTGGDRGWKGDVPVVRLDTAKIRRTGWRCSHSSRAALEASMSAMLADIEDGLVEL
jgi:UDP-glucose 4-epimerase